MYKLFQVMRIEENINQEQSPIEKGEVLMEKENQSHCILLAKSTQWSNVTIRKKSKKKTYKFQQAPNSGMDMFDLDKEEVNRIEDKGVTKLLIPIEIETTIREVE